MINPYTDHLQIKNYTTITSGTIQLLKDITQINQSILCSMLWKIINIKSVTI